jgi:hypothetical protein
MQTYGPAWLVVLYLTVGTLAWIGPAWMVGASRGRSSAGLVLGIFLGPIGLIAAFLLPASPEREAQYRAEVLKRLRRIDQEQRAMEQYEREAKERAKQRDHQDLQAFDQMMDNRYK